MRKKSLLLKTAIAVMFTFFMTVGLHAGTFGPDEVKMESEGYPEHKRGIVTYSHKKHVVDYKLECGQCHHDKNGEALPSFKMGKGDTSCSKCHDLDETHNNHTQDYDVSCGECHMDKDGNPMEEISIASCISCHKKPGLSPKGVSIPRLSKEERMKFHGEAVHQQCRDCHKSYNKEHKTTAAPTACNKCHPKEEPKEEHKEESHTKSE